MLGRRRRTDWRATPHTGLPFLDIVEEQPGSVLAFAHRGGAGHPDLDGLENTMAAFRHAVGLGYDCLETDVHLSRDGVLLVFHDDILDRVTDVTGAIAGLDLAEIRRALIAGREPVPTFAEVLEEFPQARFNIDIKAAAAAVPLADAILRHDAEHRVCVGSFSPRVLRAFRRATGGRVATSAHPLEVALWRFAPAGAARMLEGGDFGVFQVPPSRGPVDIVTPDFVRRAHAAGKHVHVWTVDEREEIERLLDLGVDGIFTDRTDTLREVLEARGQWREAS